MSFNPQDYLVTDDLTILLGLIGATLFLLNNLYKPQPLVHPILLGRQSDVARVRNPGESAVYRNYGTGIMGRFPIRPHKDVHILADLVRTDFEAPRTLWASKITNMQLQDRAAAFGTGLLRLAGLRPQESSVLLILNDSIEFIVSDLALASHSIISHTLSTPSLLSPFLDQNEPSAIIANASLLPQLLELIYDGGEKKQHTIIVVGEPSAAAMASVASQIKVLKFADVEREGIKVEKLISPVPRPQDVLTVSHYASPSGTLGSARFTHENFTAGVAATRALLPLANAISQLDTIVSAHPLSTAFGRIVAYTAIFEGTSFVTVQSSKLFLADDAEAHKHDLDDIRSASAYPIPSPTIFFAKPGHLDALAGAINERARGSFLHSFGWRHKVAGVREGFITRDSLWDRLVFDGARARAIGESAATLRAFIVAGGPIPASQLTASRIALSVPLVNTLTHPTVAGPILASHPLDLQEFPETVNATATVGPPSVNTEVRLAGVNDEAVEKGGDPSGILLTRGPSVGQVDGGSDAEGWVDTGVRVVVRTNGAFHTL